MFNISFVISERKRIPASLLTPLLCGMVMFMFFGCSGESVKHPLEALRAEMKGVPTWSVVLDDMKEEGNFVKNRFHKYKIITENNVAETDWIPVPKKVYEQYVPFLGMTLWGMKDGRETNAIGPPGYEYVGNSRYGGWRNDSSGNSFWVFYGQYRLLGDLLGSGPVYRRHYSDYSSHRSRGRPYYGANREYGTDGSLTRRRKPDFYKRAAARKSASRASFSDRVNSRIGRTRSGFTGRSGRGGK